MSRFKYKKGGHSTGFPGGGNNDDDPIWDDPVEEGHQLL